MNIAQIFHTLFIAPFIQLFATWVILRLSFFYSFIHMCIHCLGHFSPLPPPSLSPSFPPQFQAGPVLPLSLVLLKKTDKPNKEDKAVFSLPAMSVSARVQGV
jgi:hypothetical protein